MNDLVQWLRAQLDEDERIARAAGSLSGIIAAGSDQWRVSGNHTDDGGTYWSITSTSPDLARVSPVEMVGSGMSGGGAHTEEVAAHIAEHDPARVLREIGAKRGVVARYEFACREAASLSISEEERETRVQVAGALQACVLCLAAAYEDRPGYAEAIASAG